MHKNSKIWDLFKVMMLHTLKQNYFDHIFEQDAMNIAILSLKIPVIHTPSTMNWLCGASLPLFDKANNQWVSPLEPHVPISVAHLVASSSKLDYHGENITYYELYKKIGLK